ncbi:hypothetical protein bcere0007_7030 [Bacillus mycoides]|uniref:Uncharacterized protein n=1 Tax=Bacillus cereus VD048 TaxID=1053226 RepID=J8EDL9_BACCE|nr:hypothetical protein bcere0007_7030 [Bacillus mycoides]EJR29074.1 hypothetical protein IIG_04081 [Bacillus cereus VD048]
MDLFNESKKRLNYFKLFSFEMLATIKKEQFAYEFALLFYVKNFRCFAF